MPPILTLIPIAAFILLVSLGSTAHAIVNGQKPPADTRVYDAVAAFSITTWLHAGKDRTPEQAHNWFGCATLVAPDVIVTAKHLLTNGHDPGPPGRFSVRFRRRPDGGLGSREEGPESYHQVRIMRWVVAPHADLAVGYLEEPVTHIRPIPVNFTELPLDHHAGILAGWGGESNWVGNGSPRTALHIGHNFFRHQTNTRGISITDWKTETREAGKDEQGRPKRKAWITTDAGTPNMHDSGGAMLIRNALGELRLVGVISTYTGGSWLAAYAEDDRFPLQRLAQGWDEAQAWMAEQKAAVAKTP